MDDQQQVRQDQSDNFQFKPSIVRPGPHELIVTPIASTRDQLRCDRAHYVQGMCASDLVLPRSSCEPDLHTDNSVIQKCPVEPAARQAEQSATAQWVA